MKLELNEAEALKLWHYLQQQEDGLAEKVRKAAVEQGVDLKVSTLKLSGGNVFTRKKGEDFVKCPALGFTLPIETIKAMGELLNHWPVIVRTVQELELRDIPAHAFFKFPTFEVDGKILLLIKNNFMLDDKFLFNVSDLPKLLEFTQDG